MKSNLFKYTLITSFIVTFLFSMNGFSQELDASNYKLRFSIKTIKQFDNSRLLEVSFIGQNKKDRKDIVPVANAEIKFFNILNEEEILLGTSKTSNEGTAQLIIPENYNYLTEEEGNINFLARFEATDTMDEEETEVIVKNIHLELDLKEIDSVKTVFVKAFTIDSLGEETSVEEVDIIISIEGMLSKMKLTEGTIENGEFEFEFPTDIPGDVNGNLTVFSIISDNDEFGNVVQKKTINWGTFNKINVEKKNTLWSDYAPIWMYIVLTILLGGVWINYIYSIVNLFKIRKEGLELEMKKEPYRNTLN